MATLVLSLFFWLTMMYPVRTQDFRGTTVESSTLGGALEGKEGEDPCGLGMTMTGFIIYCVVGGLSSILFITAICVCCCSKKEKRSRPAHVKIPQAPTPRPLQTPLPMQGQLPQYPSSTKITLPKGYVLPPALRGVAPKGRRSR